MSCVRSWRIAAVAVVLTTSTFLSGTRAVVADTSSSTVVSGAVDLAAGCSSANGSGPHASLDPSDPRHVTVVYTAGDSVAGVAATTRDGGRMWSRAALPGMTRCTGGPDGFIGDPMLATGSGGRVVATEGWVTKDPDLGVDHDALRLLLGRSDDGGPIFTSPVEPDPLLPAQRGLVHFASGSNDGLLVVYERLHYLNDGEDSMFVIGPGEIVLARSADGGTTFGAPIDAVGPSPDQELFTIGLEETPTALVLVYASVDDRSYLTHVQPVPEVLHSVASTDGGLTWSLPQDVGAYRFPSAGASGCCIPDTTVADDGTLYVTWPDDARDGATLARSADNGGHWTTRDVSLAPGGIVEPAIAARSASDVALFFYDHLGAHMLTHESVVPKVATSGDGGITWQTSAIAPPFELGAIEGGSSDGTALGPYQDIVVAGDGYAAVVTLGDGRGRETVDWIPVSAQPA